MDPRDEATGGCERQEHSSWWDDPLIPAFSPGEKGNGFQRLGEGKCRVCEGVAGWRNGAVSECVRWICIGVNRC